MAQVASSSLAPMGKIYNSGHASWRSVPVLCLRQAYMRIFKKNKWQKFGSNNFKMNHQKEVGLFASGSP